MRLVELFGLDRKKLKELMDTNVSEANINDYGRLDELKDSVDKTKAKAYFEELEGKVIPLFKVNMRVFNLLKEFILNDGMDLYDK